MLLGILELLKAELLDIFPTNTIRLYLTDYFDILFPELDRYICTGNNHFAIGTCISLIFKACIKNSNEKLLLKLFIKYFKERPEIHYKLMLEWEIALYDLPPGSYEYAKALILTKSTALKTSCDNLKPVFYYATGSDLSTKKQKQMINLIKWLIVTPSFIDLLPLLVRNLATNAQVHLKSDTIFNLVKQILQLQLTEEKYSSIANAIYFSHNAELFKKTYNHPSLKFYFDKLIKN